MYPVAFLVINNNTYNSNDGKLPKHYLNKVQSYERKQIDIYFDNPDFLVDNQEPQYNILAIEYTQFNGIFLTEDPIRIFKKSIEFLLLNARKSLKGNYSDHACKYSILWDDVVNGVHNEMFISWMIFVTKKSTFGLKELDLLHDYKRSFYYAMKLLPEMLNGGLWGGRLCSFQTEENLLKFCQSKHVVKELPPHDKYKM